MSKINEMVNEIYDPQIEDPEYQTFMASCIKSWIRTGIEKGIILGKEELSLELEATIKKNLNPNTKILVYKNEIF